MHRGAAGTHPVVAGRARHVRRPDRGCARARRGGREDTESDSEWTEHVWGQGRRRTVGGPAL
jgi:hypothetical protein